MDIDTSFKAAVKKSLDRPIIVADCFHYSRYIHRDVDEVRKKSKRNGITMIASKGKRCVLYYIKTLLKIIGKRKIVLGSIYDIIK